jgi:hypothetical protein
MKFTNLFILFGIRMNCWKKGKSQSLCLFISRLIKETSNYRGISLLSAAYKILSYILSWLTPNAEKINGNHQCGFGCNRPTADHILCFGKILKKNENTMK